MVILKAIGAFFVKIWRWIKETAWVQPLLIVGAIFAIIFSIPYFTQWIQSLQGESSGSYFALNQKSLEGEVLINDGKDAKLTDADKLTKSISDMQTLCVKWNDSKDESAKQQLVKELEKNENKQYGEKYFLVYTADNNSNCATAETGFRYLANEWKGIFAGSAKGEFKFYSINISEKSSNDKDFEEKDENKKAFYRYLTNWTPFFNEVGTTLKTTPYCVNKNLADGSNFEAFQKPSYTEFNAPTILLIDYSKEAIDAQRAGVSEIVFSVEGDNDVRRAQFLLQMWNHCDNDSTNPFTVAYENNN